MTTVRAECADGMSADWAAEAEREPFRLAVGIRASDRWAVRDIRTDEYVDRFASRDDAVLVADRMNAAHRAGTVP